MNKNKHIPLLVILRDLFALSQFLCDNIEKKYMWKYNKNVIEYGEETTRASQSLDFIDIRPNKTLLPLASFTLLSKENYVVCCVLKR